MTFLLCCWTQCVGERRTSGTGRPRFSPGIVSIVHRHVGAVARVSRRLL